MYKALKGKNKLKFGNFYRNKNNKDPEIIRQHIYNEERMRKKGSSSNRTSIGNNTSIKPLGVGFDFGTKGLEQYLESRERLKLPSEDPTEFAEEVKQLRLIEKKTSYDLMTL